MLAPTLVTLGTAVVVILIAPVVSASSHGRQHHRRALSPRSSSSTTSPYQLLTSLDSTNFFDAFDFITYADPTHGQVTFNSQSAAEDKGLVYTTASGSIVLQADSWTALPNGTHRDSVRLESKSPVVSGSLVVLDLTKTGWGPTTWPSFWTYGAPDWPQGGEIDIIEGVNEFTVNQVTLHTSDGCKLTTLMEATGTVVGTDCNALINDNAGCGVRANSSDSSGAGFSAAGGGVYAMSWDSSAISVWFFSRADVPSDLSAEAPQPDGWPAPMARWSAGGCDMDTFFKDQTMVFDITICGDWAGKVFEKAYGGSCVEAVMDPDNYKHAQMIINSLKVYTPK